MHPRMAARHAAALFLALLGSAAMPGTTLAGTTLAGATTTGALTSRADTARDGLDVPGSVAQGGLLLGRAPAAARLALVGSDGVERPVRVAASGRFVVGVGRDDAGPVRLRVVHADGRDERVDVPVSPRDWRIERVDGVAEATVNPPPAIAERIAREQAEVAAARTRDDAREDFAGGFDWPVRGRVSGVYGSQRVYNGTPKSPHSGLDVAAPAGTPIRAPAAGVVSFARPDLYLTGGTVLLDHGHGLSSNFLHLSRLDVAVGQRVARGEVIGRVGATGRATGPHLHWGMNWFGVRIDPALLLPVSDSAAAAGAAPSR
jgi:hypothetical protein